MQDPEYETEMSYFFLERDGKNIIFTFIEGMNDEDGSFAETSLKKRISL